MSENVGLPMATAPFQTGVDKIVAARVSTIYESSDACPLVDWPYDGYYFAVDDETPTKVSRSFSLLPLIPTRPRAPKNLHSWNSPTKKATPSTAHTTPTKRRGHRRSPRSSASTRTGW
jgi:hypothetical protein